MVLFYINLCSNPLNTKKERQALFIVNYYLTYTGKWQPWLSKTITKRKLLVLMYLWRKHRNAGVWHRPAISRCKTDHKFPNSFLKKTGYLPFDLNQKSPTVPWVCWFSIRTIIQTEVPKCLIQIAMHCGDNSSKINTSNNQFQNQLCHDPANIQST